MGSPNISPFDQGRRPSQDDFNGCACVDSLDNPPQGPLDPTAKCWNTMGFTHMSAGKMIAAATIAVAAGGAINNAVLAANTVSANVFTSTKPATGKVQITWPPGTFPTTPGMQPKAYCNDTSGSAPAVTAFYIANGLEVHTFLAGALADAAFTVDLF